MVVFQLQELDLALQATLSLLASEQEVINLHVPIDEFSELGVNAHNPSLPPPLHAILVVKLEQFALSTQLLPS